MNDIKTIEGIRAAIPEIRNREGALGRLGFSSRGTYLAWRAEWRACLALSVAATRAAKGIRGDKSRDGEEKDAANSYRQVLRDLARSLFETRAEARARTLAHHAAVRAAATTVAVAA